jgi:UDP-glucose 4-epimerase
VLELIRKGHEVIVMDNLSNSSAESLERIQALTGVKVPFYELDLLDKQGMSKLFAEVNPDSVIHFAGLKAVGESVEIPLWYYKNNITGTLNLLDVMQEQGVKNLVFSSSCTVYGEPEVVPITENAPLSAVNPYGQTKLTIEYILKDLYQSDSEWNIAILRYFNPVGADESGTMGEDPNGIPNNLMPYVTQVAVGHLPYLRVFGSDYPTHDGTGVRDYIHVTDLALGHIKAIEALEKDPGLLICNLGTGNGYSVLDVVKAFEKASGVEIPYQLQPRRAGDAAAAYADPALAKELLGWQAERDLEQMCRDAWNWQQQNPEGYKDS